MRLRHMTLSPSRRVTPHSPAFLYYPFGTCANRAEVRSALPTIPIIHLFNHSLTRSRHMTWSLQIAETRPGSTNSPHSHLDAVYSIRLSPRGTLACSKGQVSTLAYTSVALTLITIHCVKFFNATPSLYPLYIGSIC